MPSLFLLWAGLAAALQTATPAWAEIVPEYALKAAVIYRIANFVEWPNLAEAPNQRRNELLLCLIGLDPFGNELETLVKRPPDTYRLSLRRLATAASAHDCDMAWLGLEGAALERALAALRGASVLTLADTNGAARRGVMVELLLENHRIGFVFNLMAIQRARLSLSSKMLRLGKTVYQEAP